MIYTLTFQSVLNIGAVLQAYALQRFIKQTGRQTKIIDYNPRYLLWRNLRPAKGVHKTIAKYKRYRKFSEFRKCHLDLTAPVRRAIDLHFLNEGDIVVCGSDQIWNLHLTNGAPDPVFFLKGQIKAKKLAYAASAGGNRIADIKEFAIETLSDFTAIGTRENDLAIEIRSLFPDATVKNVVDPSLLISDYSDLIQNHSEPGKKFIVSYEVSDDITRSAYDLYISTLRDQTGLPVIHLGAKPIASADINYCDVSPSEWLYYFKHATIVATNSFHGTAFALNFSKPFTTIRHLDEEKNARVRSLLSRSGLDHMMQNPEQKADLDKIYQKYSKSKLDEFVDESKLFLINAIDGCYDKKGRND